MQCGLMNMSVEYKCSLPDEVKKYLEEHLNETDESRVNGINTIKEWLWENPKINGCAEDTAILPFLRSCKYDLDKTKKKMKNYYTMRAKIPGWFSKRDPTLPEMQQLLDLGVFICLKEFVDNKLVYIIRAGAYDPHQFHFDDIMKMGKILLDVVSHKYEYPMIFGAIAIFDMTNVTFGHVSCLGFTTLKNLAQVFLNDTTSPKLMVFLNAPFFIRGVLNVFKRFLSAKLRNRILVCDDLQVLCEHVDGDILPEEYGGSGESVQDLTNYWKEVVISYKDWLEEDEKFKALS